MSSINFNSAATQALRTLQQSNSALDATQNRISTGLKIGEAKDNAAYWSISTTMASDNKALATVTDALGLGAATVDTAYQGLSTAKDVLDEIKSKLTAALGSNVDRTAIQAEIDSLQEQLKSIAFSSTFSGENWLSVNSSLTNYSANKTIVSSFTRDVSGSVAVGEIEIDSSKAVLFDASSTALTKGILDTASTLRVKNDAGVLTDLTFGGPGGVSGNSSTAGLVAVAAGAAGNTAASGTAAKGTQTFAFNAANLKIGDTISFNVSTDGTTPTGNTVSFKVTAANKANATAFAAAIDTAINGVSAIAGGVEAAAVGSDIVIRTQTTGTPGSPNQVKISAITATDSTTSVLGLAVGANSTGDGSTRSTVALGTYSLTNGAVGDTVTIAATINGNTRTAVVTLTENMLTGPEGTAAGFFATAATTALQASGGSNTDLEVINAAGVLTLRTPAGSSNAISAVGVTAQNASTVVGAINGTTATGTGVETFVTNAKTVFDTFTAVTLDADDAINFSFEGTAFSITKAKIDTALTVSDGKIDTVDEMVTVLNALATPNFVASKNSDGKLVLTSSSGSGTAAVSAVSAIAGPPGSVASMSVDAMDITDATLTTLGADTANKRVTAITAYINVVNEAINKVTAAATTIGAVAKRVELQQTFVQNLMDTIQKGVSGLVDADMNEESTKLQALQVKQQLGVQALSIANQSAQNVLSLFRS